jgi:hypothetical protein
LGDLLQKLHAKIVGRFPVKQKKNCAQEKNHCPNGEISPNVVTLMGHLR